MRITAYGKRLTWLLPLLWPAVVFAQSSISIGDTTVQPEGNHGLSSATFTVVRSASGAAASVQYSTSDGKATGGSSCGGSVDYVSISGSLAFTAGETSKTITVAVCGDTTDEYDETFWIDLSSPIGTVVADGRGQATIVDDDPAPSLRIWGTTIHEGNALSTNASFNVTLSSASEKGMIEFSYSTRDGSATGSSGCSGGADFVRTSGRINIPRGATSLTITVPVCGDTLLETDETFTVVLSNPTNAIILGTGDGEGECRITNDDVPTLSISDATAIEPSPSSGETVFAHFTVRLSSNLHNGASIHFTTVNGTAVSSAFKLCGGGGDYVTKAGLLEWPSRDNTLRVISVPICYDTIREGTETFTIRLSKPTGLVAPVTTAVGTIRDNP